MTTLKKVLTVSVLAVMSMWVSAQAAPYVVQPAAMVVSMEEKTPIALEDLPEAVQAALEDEEFTGWEASKAYLIKAEMADELDQYEVVMQQAEDTMTVKFDEEGKRLPSDK
jgi:hypothetical protein